MEPTAIKTQIDAAQPAEMTALTAMVRTSDAYQDSYRVMVANQTLDAGYLRANVVRVARGANGELCGFYSLLIPGRGVDGECELDFMFVANGQQRRGIGRTLMEDVGAVARRRRLARVHIVAHPPAEQFYLACGACRIGHLPPAGRVTWVRPHLVLDIGPVAR
jgi:GNAT superfamily N-acetyltransferase